MKDLVGANVVAELELVMGEEIPVRVQDALRLPGGSARVVELGGVVGRRVYHRKIGRGSAHGGIEIDVAVYQGTVLVQDEDPLERPDVFAHTLDPGTVVAVRHEYLCLRIPQPVRDPIVAVEL